MWVITNEVLSQICDKLCRFPRECENEEELEEHCSSCVLDSLAQTGRSRSDRLSFPGTVFDEIAGTPERFSDWIVSQGLSEMGYCDGSCGQVVCSDEKACVLRFLLTDGKQALRSRQEQRQENGSAQAVRR